MKTELTLMDLLHAREDRVRHQKELLDTYPGTVLISMTLNIPGPVKDSPRYRKALETGLHRLKTMLAIGGSTAQAHQEYCFAILHEEFRPLATGPEAYLVLRGEPLEIKKAAVSVEEGSALGRLFDIDVLIPGQSVDPGLHDSPDSPDSPDGIPDFPRSISRIQLGAGPRRCLLCEEDAKACARSQAHTMDQLLEKINEILSDAGL